MSWTILRLLGGMQNLKEVNFWYDDPFKEVGEFPHDFGSPAWTYLCCGLYKHRFHFRSSESDEGHVGASDAFCVIFITGEPPIAYAAGT